MYQDFYKAISQPFRGYAKTLERLNKVLVFAVAAAFIGIALLLMVNSDPRMLRYLIVCAISFVFITAIRKLLDKPRPYELYDIEPLIMKETKGKSFPSRHVFCATIISYAFWWISPLAGTIGFIFVFLLAAIRVIGGVHFPQDVIAAIVIGLLCGLIGFSLI